MTSNSASSAKSVPVDVVFATDTARDKRLPVLRAALPAGRDAVLPAAPGGPLQAAFGLLPAALAMEAGGGGEEKKAAEGEAAGGEAAGGEAAESEFDLERVDEMGRRLWFGELQVNMSKYTKQYVQETYCLMDELADFYRQEKEKSACGGCCDCGDSDASDSPPMAGVLVLRGSRCVLVRSLSSSPAWEGLRIPAVPRLEDEDWHEGCMRAVFELTGVDGPGELVPMPHVPPVMVYVPTRHRAPAFPRANSPPPSRSYGHRRSAPILAHFYHSMMPPPPGPLEDADMEDEEDMYERAPARSEGPFLTRSSL
jgi:hypothetical protein